jgi:prolyl-tRNA editing enzyme YbaK/EbsC (Cys-tRNA(Pro) deacylase)
MRQANVARQTRHIADTNAGMVSPDEIEGMADYVIGATWPAFGFSV